MPVIPVPAAPLSAEPELYTPPSFLVSRTLLPVEDLVRQYEGSSLSGTGFHTLFCC